MRIVRILLIFMVALTTSGCINGMNWNDRLNAIIDPEPMETSIDHAGVSAVDEFRGSVDTFQSEEKRENAFGDATYYSIMKKAATDDKYVKQYVLAGIALSDQLCALWFQKLGQAQAKVNADRDLVSNFGALSATVMGLADVNSAIVGGIAGGFGFAESAFTSETANFIVAPDLSKVQEAIDDDRAIRVLQLEALISKEAPLTFYQAKRELTHYNNSCSHLALKRLVNSSINQTSDGLKKQLELQENSPNSLAQAKANLLKAEELVKQLEKKLASSKISNNDSKNLENNARAMSLNTAAEEIGKLLGDKKVEPFQIPFLHIIAFEKQITTPDQFAKIYAGLKNLSDPKGEYIKVDDKDGTLAINAKIIDNLRSILTETNKGGLLDKEISPYVTKENETPSNPVNFKDMQK